MLVASGPSTERVDISLIKGLRCVAASHGYRAVPDADVLLAGGQSFWKANDLRQFRGGLMVLTKNYAPWHWLPRGDPRLVYMNRAEPVGLTDDPTKLAGSETSVALAISYVVHRGVSLIILLGCDGQPSPDGRRRVNSSQQEDAHWQRRYRRHEEIMATQIEPLRERGIGIVNCSPDSALGCYKRADLEDAIACL